MSVWATEGVKGVGRYIMTSTVSCLRDFLEQCKKVKKSRNRTGVAQRVPGS
jgi:hypothetical protein